MIVRNIYILALVRGGRGRHQHFISIVEDVITISLSYKITESYHGKVMGDTYTQLTGAYLLKYQSSWGQEECY